MKRRVVTSTLAVTAAALIIFGVPFGWAVRHAYRNEQLTRLAQAATTAAAAVPVEGLHGADPIELPTVPKGIHFTYYDTGGGRAAGDGPTRADHQVRRALLGHPAQGQVGSRLVVAAPITTNETIVGAVEASSASSAVAGRAARSWLAMLALGVGALVIAAVIAIWQARRLTGPVDEIVAAADRLGEGDFALQTRRSGVAELDRAASALEATSGRLGELVARERAFSSHASHQLRTPLTALRLSLENALQTPGVDVPSAVLDAVTEVDRLQDTLDELFVLARTGALPERQAYVPQMLASLEQRWRPLLAERGRRLYVVGDEVPKDRKAPATLEQILDILVDNAATHGRGTVEVTALLLSDGISVEVVDEGDGISAIPTSPAEPNGASTHGLGLPLARSLVEATGGRLVLRQSGRHSAIAVILP